MTSQGLSCHHYDFVELTVCPVHYGGRDMGLVQDLKCCQPNRRVLGGITYTLSFRGLVGETAVKKNLMNTSYIDFLLT